MKAMSTATRRQYKSGSVFQRKDGMWIGRFEAGKDRDGKRRQITVSAVSETLCKEKLERKKVEVARNGVPEKRVGKQDTVELWAKEWLSIIVHEQRPKAYAATASAIKVWIIPTIGRKRLVDLAPADLRAVFDAQRKAGLAESTRTRTHAVMMRMFRDARLDGHNIADRVFDVRKPKPGENDREAIPTTQAIALLQSVQDDPDGSTWAAALLQGLRQGERLGLTWSCIDFEAETIDISWQLQPLPYLDNKNKHLGFRVPDGYRVIHLERAFHLVRPKSESSRRVIPMVDEMANALRAWRDVAPHSDHDLVWPRLNGAPRRAEDDRESWKAIQAACGIAHPTGRPYLLHEARHATATLLLNLEVPREVVANILGQSKLVATYDHSDRLPAMRQALTKVAEHLALGR